MVKTVYLVSKQSNHNFLFNSGTHLPMFDDLEDARFEAAVRTRESSANHFVFEVNVRLAHSFKFIAVAEETEH